MSSQQREETQITIIGASQSGKTTLAAGLAKTSNEDFTVGFADNATRDYLQPRIAGISAGHWPEATSGEDRDICLNINTSGGRSALISFKEYMGERIHDATYLEQIVGSPNGALILLSPGMESLRDPEEREELIGNLKGVVDHLKCNKCVAIAFVVTACDRLKTDLKEFAPTFEDYVAEVTNYLNTSGLDWRRFNVTITGELQEQDKPSIAVGDDNTSREPFVWILDRVFGKKRMNSAKRILCAASYTILAALLSCIVFCGWQYLSDRSTLKAREAAIAEIDNCITAAGNSESELKKATDRMRCMIASNDTDSCWYEYFKKRLSADNDRWLKLYEKNRARYFSVSIDERVRQKTSRGSEDDCRSFDRALAEFCPTDASIKNELVASWNEKRPKIREAHDVKQGNDLRGELAKLMQRPKDDDLLSEVAKFKNKVAQWETLFATSGEIKKSVLDGIGNLENEIYVALDTQKGNAIGKDVDSMNADAAIRAKPEALEVLGKRISEWTPLTDGGKVRREDLQKYYMDHVRGWAQAYSDRCCTDEAVMIERNIRALKPENQSLEADDICATLKSAYGFSSRYTYATPETLVAATNKIGEACVRFFSAFLNSFKWDIKARLKPELSERDERFITAAFDVADPAHPDARLYVSILNNIEVKRTEAEMRWRDEKKRVCDVFIKQGKGKPAVDLYREYRDWYDRNADNPFVTNVDFVIAKEVSDFLQIYVSEVKQTFLEDRSAFGSEAGRKKASARFSEFQQLCLALAKDSCGLKDSWCVKFARECANSGKIIAGMNKAFEQCLTVTKIDVKVTEDGDYEDYIGGKFDISYLNHMIAGQELKSGGQEIFLRCDEYKDYVVNERDTWQTLWEGTKRLSLSSWTHVGFYLGASLDLSGTPEDAKGDVFCTISPSRSRYKGGFLEMNFKCHYLTWGGANQYYTCHVRIYCACEGADIFGLFDKYRH